MYKQTNNQTPMILCSQTDKFSETELESSEKICHTNEVELLIVKVIGSSVMKTLKKLGLDLLFCVGIEPNLTR